MSHEGVRHETERGFKLFPGIGLRKEPCVCTRVSHGRSVRGRCNASRMVDGQGIVLNAHSPDEPD